MIKEVETDTKQPVSQVQFDESVSGKSTQYLEEFIHEMEKEHKTISIFVNQTYKPYMNYKIYKYAPTISNIIFYFVMSYFEKHPNDTIKVEFILEMLRLYNVGNPHPIFSKYMIDYYDTPNTWRMILRNKRDRLSMRDVSEDVVAGFIWYSREDTPHLWIWSSSTLTFTKILPLELSSKYSHLFIPIDKLDRNKNKLYGYVSHIPKPNPTYAFYVVYDTHDRDPTEAVSKKKIIRGAVCATGMNTQKKQQLENIIKGLYDLLEIKKYVLLDLLKAGYCSEMEMLLKHLDRVHPSTSLDHRYYYRLGDIPRVV